MRFLLVGTVFTQGALAVIAKGLRQAVQVELRAEPENPYDANAVRVFVGREEVQPSEELAEALAAFGLSVEAITWPMAIGHLGAKYETKAAKAALREGHQFHLASEWHAEAKPVGRLMQHSDGVLMIEV